jgi:inorganic pyrophosphatase/exopolyphosphatase
MNWFNKLFGTNPKQMARTQDPDTSKEAAETVQSAQLEQLVYEVIKEFPNGCTSEEVERALYQYRSHSITPRFAPLLRKGLIVDTGFRKKSASGRSQRVVRAV